jgi:hypothetical protein
MFKCDLETGRITYTAVPGVHAAFTATSWQGHSYPRHVLSQDDSYGFMGFYHERYTSCVPVWFLALLSVALAALPWVYWSKRFRLRTLLIATTLVAVGLGLIVWAAKR